MTELPTITPVRAAGKTARVDRSELEPRTGYFGSRPVCGSATTRLARSGVRSPPVQFRKPHQQICGDVAFTGLQHDESNLLCVVYGLSDQFCDAGILGWAVGMHAVYPTGVHYDRIPFSTPYAQKRMSEDLGPLDAYILRLDQRCNIVFAVAFMFVFLLVFIAFAYLQILLVYSFLRPNISAEAVAILKLIGLAILAIYLLIRHDSLFMNSTSYDDKRAENEYVGGASIQSDVISEPFIRLYIAYPKALDTLLTRLAKTPARIDTLPRLEKRRQLAIWSTQQIGRLMRITVNDSLYSRPDLLFTQRGQLEQRGWQTVLIPTNLRTGKNTIQVGIQADSLSKPEDIITIPFWYVPGK